MTDDTNLPEFAQTMAAIPKRLRKGIGAAQHGRENEMLIHTEDDTTKFIGRLTKNGRGKFTFETFEGEHTEESAKTAKVVTEGRVRTPLRGITLVRQFHKANQA